jgi:hypothetical protein
MDVVLGVAVADRVARLALVGSGAGGGGVIDQSVVDLADRPIEMLAETVVGTSRLLADENHRLVATRLCWSDGPSTDTLRRLLEDSGVQNVAVLDEPQAATALIRTTGAPGSAVLVVGDEAATLLGPALTADDVDSPPTVLAAGTFAGNEATGALDTMMARLGDPASGVRDVYLVGSSSELTSQVANQLQDSTMRVSVPEDPTFALARGAAMSALPPTMAQSALLTGDATALSPQLGGDATAMSPQAYGDATAMSPQAYGADATAMSPQAYGADATAISPQSSYGDDATTYTPSAPIADTGGSEQQLAYSMAGEQELLPVEMDEYGPDDEYDEFDEDAETGPVKLSRGSLLIGNAVVAFAVIGLASLAVAVAVSVRPTAASEPVVGHQNAAPGKFMPLLPTQQQAPVPPPAPDSPNVGYQGGIIPDNNGYIPPQLIAPGGGGGVPAGPVAPVPAAPVVPAPVPGFVPDPRLPIPVPIFIPFPNWRPPLIFVPPPFLPPIVPKPQSGPSSSPVVSTPAKKPFASTTPPTNPSGPSTPSTKPLVPSSGGSTPSGPSTTPSSANKQPSTSQGPQPSTTPPSAKQTTVGPTTQAPLTTPPPKTQTQAPQTTVPPKTQTQPPTQAPQQPKPQTQAPAPVPQQPVPQQPVPQQPKPQVPAPVPQQPKPQVPAPVPQQPKPLFPRPSSR